ncbi:MAG: HicB family protein [Bacilli bacterium]|nr:HicB family protein [Bacilli bacterium]
MMNYKGYLARIELDSEAGIFHGEVINTKDVITFQGKSVEELQQALNDSVEDYLEFCAQRGEEPEKPYSGNFLVRLSPEYHRIVSMAAIRSGVSLNSWVTDHIIKDAKQELGDLFVPDQD